MRPFKELEVWRLAPELALETYRVTHHFPVDERFGLTSQLRRAASSIPANIAEGSARGDVEFRQFLRVALGSASEVEYFLILSHDLDYLKQETRDGMLASLSSIKRMLLAFRSALV